MGRCRHGLAAALAAESCCASACREERHRASTRPSTSVPPQFFTHTQLIDRCWWPVELVMNTPSHHRVHHARNYGRR